MNIKNFKPDEFINQFESKLESEGSTPEEIRAFRLGVISAISGVDGLIEKGATTTELTIICTDFGKALKGGQA